MKNNNLNLNRRKKPFLKTLLLLIPALFLSIFSYGQCPSGETELTLSFGSGAFNDEIKWELIQDPGNNVILSQEFNSFIPHQVIVECVPGGDYKFNAYDAFGDGWNGATVKVEVTEDYSNNGCQANPPTGTVLLPTTMPQGGFQQYQLGTLSCTPQPPPPSCPEGETQLNLNFGTGTFNNEISWELVETESNTVVLSETAPNFSNGSSLYECVPDGNYKFDAYDSFGDGWNGATVEIIVSDDYSINGCNNPYQPTGTVVLSSTVPAGSFQSFPLGDIGCKQQKISINDVSQAEGNWWGVSTFKFTVTRSEGTDACSVKFATADGTATSSDPDYNNVNGTLSFPAGGSNTKNLWMIVRRDNKAEPDENFFINLTDPVNCVIIDNQGEGTILNDDGPPVIANDDPTLQNQLDKDNNLTHGVNVFPNPAKDEINIKISPVWVEEGAINAILYDKAGREIQNLSLNSPQTNLNIEELPRGVYNIFIQKANGEKVVKKFLKVE